MRELANMAARTAIDKSMRGRWTQAAIGKTAVALISLIISVILFSLAPDLKSATFFAAAAALLISLFWGVQSSLLAYSVYSSGKTPGKQKEKKEAESAQEEDEKPANEEAPSAGP